MSSCCRNVLKFGYLFVVSLTTFSKLDTHCFVQFAIEFFKFEQLCEMIVTSNVAQDEFFFQGSAYSAYVCGEMYKVCHRLCRVVIG